MVQSIPSGIHEGGLTAARAICCALGLMVFACGAAFAQTVTGTAEVIDSDLLLVGEHRIYLLGVESLEQGQTCEIGTETWDCYPAAVRMLQTITYGGEVSCEIASGPDFLNQAIARCTLAGEDIGAQYVRSGFALTLPAETDAYQDEMEAAKAEKLGLWQSRFALPSEWRSYMGVLADRPTFRPAR
jgi:endonuclease YncB( thermonuclease family)